MTYFLFMVYATLLGLLQARYNLKPYDTTALCIFFHATNGDVSMHKWQMSRLFASHDLNNDGITTEQEFVTGFGGWDDLALVIFDDYDMNLDYKLNILDNIAYFAKVDSNGDGSVTESEFVTYWTKIFTDHFAPNDQYIESLKPYNKTASNMFWADDIYSDGIFTVSELKTQVAAYDANRDGIITRQEYGKWFRYSGQISPNWIFDDYDQNNDNKLDCSDFDAYFARVDGNGNGWVSEIEFVKYWTNIFRSYEYYGY